ncbi:hypothetical protein ES703_00769 [subsurface metagenome]
MFGFAIRNAFRRKGVAVFAILGTALGVALMTVLLSISDGMDHMMTQTMDRLAGDVVIYPQDAPMGFMIGGGTPIPVSYVEDIEGLEHVEVVSPSVVAFVPKKVADFGDPIGVPLAGIEPGRDAEMDGATVHVVDGRSVAAEGEIIELMRRLNEEEGKTFIIVTHDHRIAERAQRIFYLRDGRLFDSPDEEYS